MRQSVSRLSSITRSTSGVRATVLASALLMSLAACKRDDAPADAAGPPTSSAAPEQQASPPADIGTQPTEAAAFNASDLPVSNVPLGSFPYLGLPQGYVAKDVVQSGFDRVPFWTGDRVEWVEGKVYSAAVQSNGEQPYSQLEINRNVQALVEELGGKRIFSGKLPSATSQEIGNDKAAVTYVGGIGDIYNEPAETYVIHREDRDIWVHLGAGGSSAGLLLVETKPVQITAKVLQADALKQALQTKGTVAIQVNFATDAAQILPESEPQIEQVTALLKNDDQLRLSVEGHTDNSGGEAHNQKLSQARADAVRERLVAAGINAARLTAKGHGQSQPVADNATEQGRAQNRRVELVKR